jgi:hypothetical protein
MTVEYQMPLFEIKIKIGVGIVDENTTDYSLTASPQVLNLLPDPNHPSPLPGYNTDQTITLNLTAKT